MDLSKAIVLGRSYILCAGGRTYEGKIIRKSARVIEMSCAGELVRIDVRQVTAVLEPTGTRRSAVA